jgi:hypothetical protein
MSGALRPPTSRVSKKPSTLFLILLNGLIFYCLLGLSSNIFGLILGIFTTAVFMAFSGIWHGIVVCIERKRHLKPPLRTGVFLLPVIILVVLPMVGIHPPQKINKQDPAVSPSREFSARVGTKDGYWLIQISDREGNKVHTEHTDFVDYLNVYWIWDEEDRFWAFNSDDQTVHCWCRDDEGVWQWLEWGSIYGERSALDDLRPPEDLYPDYAK